MSHHRSTPPFLLALALLGCGASQPDARDPGMRICTEIGCQSEIAVVTASIALPNGATGTHRFDITADGVSQTCTLVVSASESNVSASCTGDAGLFFGPATRNVEDRTSYPGVVSVQFVPVPGEFTWQLTLPGTLASVSVVHSIDGREFARREEALSYGEVRPNGPDCEPACSQASLSWDFSP